MRSNAPPPADRGSPVCDADMDGALVELASSLSAARVTAEPEQATTSAVDEELFGATPLQRSMMMGAAAGGGARGSDQQLHQGPAALPSAAAQVRSLPGSLWFAVLC